MKECHDSQKCKNVSLNVFDDHNIKLSKLSINREDSVLVAMGLYGFCIGN